MEKLINTELIHATIDRLENDPAAARDAMDMQLQLVDVLVPLQLHVQRAALVRAKSEGEGNSSGYPEEKINWSIELIDKYLARLDGHCEDGQPCQQLEASEILRMHYSPIGLLVKLQSLEPKHQLHEY